MRWSYPLRHLTHVYQYENLITRGGWKVDSLGSHIFGQNLHLEKSWINRFSAKLWITPRVLTILNGLYVHFFHFFSSAPVADRRKVVNSTNSGPQKSRIRRGAVALLWDVTGSRDVSLRFQRKHKIYMFRNEFEFLTFFLDSLSHLTEWIFPRLWDFPEMSQEFSWEYSP